MNTRLQELSEQAEQYVNNAMDERANNKDFTFGDIDEMYSTKFAELIVQECANQVDWILAEGGKTQGDLIKEHFGVEP